MFTKKVSKDYTGTDVTPENFVNVLTGNKKAMVGKGSGKVLESGPNDHVFVNFVDHGATGIIGFPNSVMYKHDLIAALKKMHKKKMFKKLVFYMEACESGSMFDKALPSNINIFATTAANPAESSYACYWDEDVEAYLGDEYSVAWMEDIDSEEHFKNLTTETLLRQYKNVVKRVSESHPSMYGEISLDKDKVKDYVGVSSKSVLHGTEGHVALDKFKDSVSSRDVALKTLEKKIEKSNDEAKKSKLTLQRDTMIEGRRAVDELFSLVVGKINVVDPKSVVDSYLPVDLDVMPSYKTVVDYFTTNCVNISKNTYALAHLYKLANLLVLGVSPDDVIHAFSQECTEQHRSMTEVH